MFISLRAGLLLLSAFLCFPCFLAMAQPSGESIERRVEQLLETRDVGELADELARAREPQKVESILIKVSVFARAGHRARVLDAVRQIVQASDYKTSPYQSQIFRVAQKATVNDVAAKRAFYELIAFNGDENINDFVWQWEKEGDLNELENWLEARASTNETWWNHWINLKIRRGKQKEVCDKLAEDIRQNPADMELVRRYLFAAENRMPVSRVIEPTAAPHYRPSYVASVAWLADTVKTDLAYEAYDLAAAIARQAPSVAIKLLKKSLSLPFTPSDVQLMNRRGFRYASIPPTVTNPETQLRYWTKKLLADIYVDNKQARLAQPLVEDLVAMDTRDIQTSDTFRVAGMVQASTGQRVVEKTILDNEAAKLQSPTYWIERASYYKGREEFPLAWQTILTALKTFPYKPNDTRSSSARSRILWSLGEFANTEEQEAEAEAILRRELAAARRANDGNHILAFVAGMNDAFEELKTEFFVNTDLLPFVLNHRKSWSYYEEYLISFVMDDEKWEANDRDHIWQQLTALARQNLQNRALMLAKAMEYNDVTNIPLLLECLSIAPVETRGDINFTRGDIEELLFEAYLDTSDWRKAEKMYAGGFRAKDELARIALTAIKVGALNDALRIWRISANRDRRDIAYLDALSKTAARPLLQEFYREMRQRDTLTNIPEKALALLN